jgi:hypothetical protein
MKNPAALLAVLGTSDRGGLSPNACRVKGFSNVESNAGVERLVRVIAADRAAGLGSAKRRRAPPHALGGARLGKPDRSRRMVTEKVAALAEAQTAAATVVIKGGKSHRVAKKVLGVYKKRVRANRRRLTKT